MNRSSLRASIIEATKLDNVYLKPPESSKLEYPCVIFKKTKEDFKHADNVVFKRDVGYTATLIYKDYDSVLPEKMSTLKYCRHEKHFEKDGMYHDIYLIY